MKKIKIALMALTLLLTACVSPMKHKEVKELDYNCYNVKHKIALLAREKENNNRRILSGIRSIIPFTAIISLLKGMYLDNLAIAFGSWAKSIDNKIAEMQEFKKTC